MSNTTDNSACKRIEALLDENSFVEIGGAVTARATDFNLKAKDTPADGVITGYGLIDGSLVYVYSQDPSVLKGAVGEMHAKKIADIYDMAMKMGAPVIGLVDCAGLRLQEAVDALHGFGTLYLKQTLASGVVPQITAILGSCGGGLAVIPALTDFTFIENKNGRLFVNSPNALEGNRIEKCDTASAKFQSQETGLVDYCGTEEEIFVQIRKLVTLLPANNDDAAEGECTDDPNRACQDMEGAYGDAGYVLSAISDDHDVFECKSDYAKEMVTALIRLNGTTVGAVANRTEIYDEEGNVSEKFDAALTARGCKKAADFVNFCDAFSIPVLTLTNVTGFSAKMCSEKNIAREAGKLIYAFANATVPKVNVVTGKAYGSAYVAMNSKSIGADIVYAWPDSEIGMMDAKLAAKIMYAGEPADVIEEKASEYSELQKSPQAAARRGYVDAVVEPADTRKYLIGAFEMLYTKREERPVKKHGTV